MSGAITGVKRLGVLGGGTMGSGIAQSALLADAEILLIDVDSGQLERARGVIEHGVNRLVSRERISEEQGQSALAALTTTTDMEALVSAQGVIEAVSENVTLKQGIFERLEDLCADAAFLASNTSSLSIQEIAQRMSDPSRVVGLHYFNPAQVLPLVEVVVPLTASEEAVQAAWAFVESTGKTPVRVKDTPAFIVNRLLVPFCLSALRLWESGVARLRTSIRPASLVWDMQWVHSRRPTWLVWMYCWTWLKACSERSATRHWRHRRSCGVWSRQAAWVVRPDAASMNTVINGG